MTSPDTTPAKADASAVEVLRSLEWSGWKDRFDKQSWELRGERACLCCGAQKSQGHTPDCRLAAALQSSSSAEAGDPGSMRVAPSHGNAEGSGTTSGVGAPAPGPSDGLLREQLQKEIEATITAQAERDSYRDAMLIAIEQRDPAEARAKTAEAERDALRNRVKVLEEALWAIRAKMREDVEVIDEEDGPCLVPLDDDIVLRGIDNLLSAALNHGKGEDARDAVTKDQGGEHGE